MDDQTRKNYLATIISDEDKKALEKYAAKLGKKLEEIANDILTLSITTRYEGQLEPAAKTNLYFDGDIDVILPKKGGEIDQKTLEFHQKMVDLAMNNRRELIRIFVELFDLKDLVKF
jgi:hypothetical protein